jgi:hypothetical protein
MGALKKIRRLLRRGQRKTAGTDLLARYRDIVSDPLNLLIFRHPRAGCTEEGLVYLHNGLRVHFKGERAYYGNFSDILVINRGVHEPLEEYVFQTLLNRIGPRPKMLELGAYWGHYSMWLKVARPEADVILVEPNAGNLAAGRSNFRINAMTGEFIEAYVGEGQFEVDQFLRSRDLSHLDILHADIQGHEVQMLQGASEALAAHCIDYVLVSTHGDERHRQVGEALRRAGYRVEVESDCATETTSFDGLVFATSPKISPLFSAFTLFGRNRIRGATPEDLLASLTERSNLDAGQVSPHTLKTAS